MNNVYQHFYMYTDTILQGSDPAELITPAEVEAAREAWSLGPQAAPQPKKREHPM